MRPTKRHFLEKSAELAHSAENKTLEGLPEYEKMLYLLSRHKKDLKDILATDRKAEFKKRILPDYLPWITGALREGSGKQDNVLMTWLVWAIDCGEYHLALEIASYAIFHDLRLPDGFTRTVPMLVAEEFADAAKIAKATNQPFNVGYLQQAEQLIRDIDILDESHARLLKELGLSLVETSPETALVHLEKAFSLNMNIGVKTDIKKLRKQLGKTEENSDGENDGEADNDNVEHT